MKERIDPFAGELSDHTARYEFPVRGIITPRERLLLRARGAPISPPQPQPPKTMPQIHTIKMTKFKDCKHSVVFKTADPEAAVDSVYVSRKVQGIDKVRSVTVTVQAD